MGKVDKVYQQMYVLIVHNNDMGFCVLDANLYTCPTLFHYVRSQIKDLMTIDIRAAQTAAFICCL